MLRPSNLETIHINLRNDILGGFTNHYTFLRSLCPHLTTLKRLVITNFIQRLGKWSVPRDSPNEYANVAIRYLLGVRGRLEFIVLCEGSSIFREVREHKVIEQWTWEAEEGQVFKSAYEKS